MRVRFQGCLALVAASNTGGICLAAAWSREGASFRAVIDAAGQPSTEAPGRDLAEAKGGIDPNAVNTSDVPNGSAEGLQHAGRIYAGARHAQDEGQRDIDRRCCDLSRKYGIVWGETWGSAPDESQSWFAKHACSRNSCRFALEASTAHDGAHSEKYCCTRKNGILVGGYAPKPDDDSQEDSQESGALIYRHGSNGTSLASVPPHKPRKIRQEASNSSLTAEHLRLAVMWTGVKERLVLESTIEEMIRPTVKDGHVVHAFMDLVAQKNVYRWWTEGKPCLDPSTKKLTDEELLAYIARKVNKTGGLLAYFRLSKNLDKLDPLPAFTQGRMRSYSPCCTPVGLSVIRRLKTYQRTWQEIVKQEHLQGKKYDFVVNQREDAYWAYSLVLRHYAAKEEEAGDSKPRLYSRGCGEFAGFSDKVFFMNRMAGDVFHSQIYRDYYEVSDPKLDHVDGAESYLKNYITYKGIHRAKMEFRELPVLDGQWTKDRQDGELVPLVCVRAFYAMGCSPLPVDLKKCVNTKSFWRNIEEQLEADKHSETMSTGGS
eukprot:TRINITY_DN27938_c0_g1_i1.p1 TRINITY_DN27938_c0_g1~~TRINITY_DN27938_c0_g1_i1.p1  ORF type:complete len:543 (+),score=61.06 TRINITY_DN27938_c0_g1_i1:120-1748(+)